jgi:hypothetical protein
MTPEDYRMYEEVLPEWAEKIKTTDSVAVLSPNPQQLALLQRLFPEANVQAVPRHQGSRDLGAWDLNYPSIKCWDLVVAQNVWHYSPRPLLWFRNAFAACRDLWVQDLIDRWRGEPDGLGPDGDTMRYCLLPGYRSSHPVSFDLCWVGNGHLLDFRQYHGGGTPERPAKHFLAWLKGDRG